MTGLADELLPILDRLCLAGGWITARELAYGALQLPGLSPEHRAALALAAAEIEVDRHWWQLDDPEHADQALARAAEQVHGDQDGGTHVALLQARHDYCLALQSDTLEQRREQAASIRPRLEHARGMFEAAGDRRRAAWTTFYLGVVADNLERDPQDSTASRDVAAEAFKQADWEAAPLGDDLLLAETSRHLSVDSHRKGDLEETLRLVQRSFDLAVLAGALPLAAAARVLLARRLAGAGRDPQRVTALSEEALTIARALRLTWIQPEALALLT